MAVGDLIGSISPINPSSTFTVQPSEGSEWIIHNIYSTNTVDVKVCEATGTIPVYENLTTNLSGYFFHASNAHYFQIVNKVASTIYAGYDGVVSK